MKSLSIKLFIFIFAFLAAPLIFDKDVQAGSAPGAVIGNVYMMYEGRRYELKDVFIDKAANCNNIHNEALGDYNCANIECRGKGEFCPTKPQSYYTDQNGQFRDAPRDPTLMIKQLNNLKWNRCDGDPVRGNVNIGCGIDCGINAHEFKAYFPANYDLNNFPFGLDFRKGHWRAVKDRNEMTRADARNKILVENGNEYYHVYPPNDDWSYGYDFEWMPDPFPIAGKVTRSDNGQPAGGVEVVVIHNKQNGQVGQEIKVTTDNNTGRFKIENVSIGDGYAVRIPDQANYKNPKTTTVNWSLNNVLGNDQPPNSPSYEQQQVGTDDCSGSDKNIPRQAGRCNFKVDATFSAPPPPADMCSSTRTPINSFSINDQNSTDSVIFDVWLPGEVANTRTIPVAVNVNGTCSVKYINFKYISTVTPPSSPDPILCAKATNRPDNCACALDNQCQGQKCDQNRQVCSTEAFIRTEGGDVHSNVKIEQ